MTPEERKALIELAEGLHEALETMRSTMAGFCRALGKIQWDLQEEQDTREDD